MQVGLQPPRPDDGKAAEDVRMLFDEGNYPYLHSIHLEWMVFTFSITPLQSETYIKYIIIYKHTYTLLQSPFTLNHCKNPFRRAAVCLVVKAAAHMAHHFAVLLNLLFCSLPFTLFHPALSYPIELLSQKSFKSVPAFFFLLLPSNYTLSEVSLNASWDCLFHVHVH